MSQVPGLQACLAQYDSDKVKERDAGRQRLRDIFGNPQNLELFQESASRDGGEGWKILFGVLCGVVKKEKRLATRSSASAPAERRLTDAIALVRWMAERSVHLLSRKPFLALFQELTSTLVYGKSIFPPAALQYAKALRTLLSYPPHLAALEESHWRILMTICWSAVLGDEVNLEEGWEGADGDISMMEAGNSSIGTAELNGSKRLPGSSITQAAVELVTLIPILVGSAAAPLIPALPEPSTGYHPTPSLGHAILVKISRFLSQHTSETTAHLPILRSLNIVLGELELNCRQDLVNAGLRLLLQLVGLWQTRSRVIREQVVLAIRIILPFVIHKSVLDKDKAGVVRDCLERLVEALPKEVTSRSGIEPLDIANLRIRLRRRPSDQPFSTTVFMPGFGFTADHALAWSVLELYADSVLHLSSMHEEDSYGTPRSTHRATKRRRVADSIDALLAETGSSSATTKLLAIQILAFGGHRYRDTITSGVRSRILETLVSLLDNEHEDVQNWSFCALSMLCSRSLDEDGVWGRVWAHAIRKVASASTRGAAVAALAIIELRALPLPTIVSSLSSLLQSLDVQGPPYPYDSVCVLLAQALQLVKEDFRLYNDNVQVKVLDWLLKWDAVDGIAGKSRLDAVSSIDLMRLLAVLCRLPAMGYPDDVSTDYLPDSAIVSRVLVEYETDLLRRFILRAELPPYAENVVVQQSESMREQAVDTQMVDRVFQLLSRQLDRMLSEWRATDSSKPKAPAAERVRRASDICVLTTMVWASCSVRQVDIKSDAMHKVSELLERVLSSLAQTAAYQTTAHLLMWRAFEPLVVKRMESRAVWPMLIKADSSASGIRPDLWPRASADVSPADSLAFDDLIRLQQAAWTNAALAPPLRRLLKLAEQSVVSGSSLAASQPTWLTQSVQVIEDDDFGEIRTADADLMPTSKEILDGRMTSAALLDLQVLVRLRGSALALGGEIGPVYDLKTINAFLGAEGPLFLELGRAMIRALEQDLLRFNEDAVVLALDVFEDMLRTYGYGRDERLVHLILSLLKVTTDIWLGIRELCDRVLHLVKSLINKSNDNQLPSWQSRLSLLLFLDEYLDYDPAYSSWGQAGSQSMSHLGWGPLYSISEALVDRDARVRFRAASTTAALFYLDSLTRAAQYDFYTEAISRLPRETKHWDSFLTDILFKLNVCVASSSVRTAALYHLYEVPMSTHNFDQPLQSGLEAVAKRLGLPGLKDLYAPHAVLITSSQLASDQSPLTIAPQLYGFASRKDYAEHMVPILAPALLSRAGPGHSTAFAGLCDSLQIAEQEVIARHFAASAALTLVQDNVVAPKIKKNVDTRLFASFPGHPTFDMQTLPSGLFEHQAVMIIVHLLIYLDIPPDWETAGTRSNLDSSVYQSVAPGEAEDAAADSLDPKLSPESVLAAIDRVLNAYPSASYAQVCFNALIGLFHASNTTYLASEQLRYSRSIALLAARFTDGWANQLVPRLAARESLRLLQQPGPAGRAALRLLQWSMTRISGPGKPSNPAISSIAETQTLPATQVLLASEQEDDPWLVDTLAQLGAVYDALDPKPEDDGPALATALQEWIQGVAPSWEHKPAFKQALNSVSCLWPADLSRHLKEVPQPTFAALVTLAESAPSANVAKLSQQLATRVLEGNFAANVYELRTSTFWLLKDRLFEVGAKVEGMMPFLDLLNAISGQVGMPDADLPSSRVGRLAQTQFEKIKKLPDDIPPRLSILQYLVDIVGHDDIALRYQAYELLRTLKDHATPGSTSAHSALSTSTGRLLTLLGSASPLSVVSPLASLDTLTSASMWTDRTRRPDEWFCDFAALLACLLSAHPFYAALPPILRSSPKVSREILPHLVHGLLTTTGSTGMTTEEVKTMHKRSSHIGSYFEVVLKDNNADQRVKQAILDVIVHLRSWNPPWRSPGTGYLRWLSVDSVTIAREASKCGSYATALQYLEIAFYDGLEGEALDLAQSEIQQILYDVYTNVEDADGFYGIPSTDVLSGLERRLQHEGDHWRAFGLSSATLESNPTTEFSTIRTHGLRDLQQLGFNQMAASLARSGNAIKPSAAVPASAEADNLLSELAWRTGDWDLPIASHLRPSGSGQLFTALRAIHRTRDLQAAEISVGSATSSALRILATLDSQRMSDINDCISTLLCLREAALWLRNEKGSLRIDVTDGKVGAAITESFWERFDFSISERLLSVKQSLLSASMSRDTTASPSSLAHLAQEQKVCYLQLSKSARRFGNLQSAFNAAIAIRQLPAMISTERDVQDELTQVLWEQGEHSLAIRTAEGMMSGLERKKTTDGSKLAVMLGRVANWTSKAKLRAPIDVLALFEDATRLASVHQISPVERARVAHVYAVFADAQQAALARDPEYERLRSFVTGKQHELSQSQVSAPSNKRKSAASKVREQSEIEFEEDTAAVDRISTSQTTYIKTALKMFALALTLTEEFDDSIIRLCSLWLEVDKAEDINVTFSGQLAEIPSHKFLFLGPQLAARLDLPKRSHPFNDNLNGLMLRLSRQHPFHILYQVITLASGFTISNNSKGARASDVGAEGRAPAADQILKSLSAPTDKQSSLPAIAVKQMRMLVDAARPWCLWQESGKKSSRGQHDVPPDALIRKLNNLSIPIPTRAPPVDAKARYYDTPTLLRYSTHYQILGGIHRPKRMAVYDSNKAFFVELFKGEDEVRQDAVMEQVFEMSNRLLSKDRQAKQRSLKFRTYTVIPLPDTTGILEFVGDGQGIGEWLKPAHNLYRKNKDIPADTFRQKLDPIQQKKWDNPQIVTAWRELMSNFKPVMHHFFTEKHKDPMAWFAMRLAYIRSVAVTSMVGWVLGIGDRHCSNIMIDRKTGELVHIDFGIVFEEGQRLRIPERVPFRLTNDIVDGLGIFGVDGTFRQCSQHTLRVLRESSDVIMTVLEVFKHDPLYAWAGDPEKLQRAQGGRTHVDHALSSTTAVEKADRVLSRIRQKLRQDLSVEYQVNQLVQDARNEEHLAKIFVGWQSWF